MPSSERMSDEAFAAMVACNDLDAPIDCPMCVAHGECFLCPDPNDPLWRRFEAERTAFTAECGISKRLAEAAQAVADNYCTRECASCDDRECCDVKDLRAVLREREVSA